MRWKVEARDKDGRVFQSIHATKAEAKQSAQCCRGKHPFGNRVRVVPITDDWNELLSDLKQRRSIRLHAATIQSRERTETFMLGGN